MRDPALRSIGRHPKETVAVAPSGLEDWKEGLVSGKMREKLWRGFDLVLCTCWCCLAIATTNGVLKIAYPYNSLQIAYFKGKMDEMKE
jgi:hypothetical protein